MKAELIMSIKDDFDEKSGPSTVTHVFLVIDGLYFEVGKFYEGQYGSDDTSRRLQKVIEFGEFLKTGKSVLNAIEEG